MRRFFGALGFVAVLLAALRPHCRAASERLTFSSHRAIGLMTNFFNGGSSLDSEAVEYVKLGCPCPRRMLAFAGHAQSSLSQRQIQPLFLCPLGRFSARGGLHGSTYGNGITTILSARHSQGVRGLRVGSARTNWHVSAYSRTCATHALKEAVRQRVAVNRKVHLSQSAGNSNADSEKDAVGNAGGAGAAGASKVPATGDGNTTIYVAKMRRTATYAVKIWHTTIYVVEMRQHAIMMAARPLRQGMRRTTMCPHIQREYYYICILAAAYY